LTKHDKIGTFILDFRLNHCRGKAQPIFYRFSYQGRFSKGQKETRLDRLVVWLASAGYMGYFPFAPGTAGTIVGVLVYALFSSLASPIYMFSSAAAFFLAWWVSGRAEVIFARKDSPRIVIDEVVGYLVTMTLLPRTLTTVIGGFLFFRVLDIIKPPPAGFIERRMQGGLAVVLDDVVAGIYANLLLQAIAHWHPHLLFIVDRWFLGPV
jgi:phosphatidylglycerophosphatase A